MTNLADVPDAILRHKLAKASHDIGIEPPDDDEIASMLEVLSSRAPGVLDFATVDGGGAGPRSPLTDEIGVDPETDVFVAGAATFAGRLAARPIELQHYFWHKALQAIAEWLTRVT